MKKRIVWDMERVFLSVKEVEWLTLITVKAGEKHLSEETCETNKEAGILNQEILF